MKRNISRFLSVMLAVVLLAVLCVPTFAASSPSYEQRVGFWGWLSGKGGILPDFIGYMTGTICPKSEDGYHHASTYQSTSKKEGYFRCICTYCGQEFTAYESDLQQSYQQQVSTLPASGITSNGSFIWYPTIADVRVNGSPSTHDLFVLHKYDSLEYKFSTASRYVLSLSSPTYENGYFSSELTSDRSVHSTYSNPDAVVKCGSYGFVCMDFCVPVTGYYTLVSSPFSKFTYIDNSGHSGSGYKDYAVRSFDGVKTSGANLSIETGISIGYSLNGYGYYYAFSVDFWLPIFEFTPLDLSSFGGNSYDINTRPTVIDGGNYGIIGDGNQITTITDNRQIINEGDNLYYNPATGQTYTITDWTYNYDGRIYNITLDTGDKVSVEYGDENITIVENNVVEGDTIVNNYTIYYMIDGGGSGENPDPTPGPTACPHEWYKTGERQATCLIPAQRTYTCSICGEQKTETDPVLGHSWHAIQTVTTQYDENGNMTQEGYTIYECERCGEQYKSTNDTGPPPSGGGGSGGGSGDNIFSGIFGLIWDFFTFLFDLFSEFVVGGIKGFINGLKDAGSSFFSILNPFSWDYGG